MKYVAIAFVLAGLKVKLIILIALAILLIKIVGVRAEFTVCQDCHTNHVGDIILTSPLRGLKMSTT